MSKLQGFLFCFIEIQKYSKKDGLSPAQRLLNRPMRTKLPAHPQVFKPLLRKEIIDADKKALQLRGKAKERYDVGAKTLSELKVGDIVCVQHQVTKKWDLVAEVKEINVRRSYLVMSETGRLYWRNRRFLRPYRVKECKPLERSKDDPGQVSSSPRRGTRLRQKTDFYRA